ncbi:EPIDERMAL PATTERNING FACTOR-like protein 4 [Phoenix dactylifera]|uniref:Epidermal patterning factor-like protein n=1 Tax=Phoenix dactylifera TaxID=42345 RepID=A0A8B7D226_PHODC|nr:EPIDERMAL PATTERNING FACTOR-like protein 4 [Phoenix dactylifera]
MGVVRHRSHRLSVAFALFFVATALGSGLVVEVVPEGEEARTRHYLEQWEQAAAAVVARLRVVGPGSSPPTCQGRCGRCFPCHPVHVAIQPWRSTPMEYYPEAWRCKCGNNLFMP